MNPTPRNADDLRRQSMRQTILMLTLIFCVVLTAHYWMVVRANAARAEMMLQPLPPPEPELATAEDPPEPADTVAPAPFASTDAR